MNHYCTERLAIFSHYQKPTSSSWETVIRISDPDFNPDHAQLWTRSSYDHYLPTHQISSKSDQSFLRNPANKQTNKQTNRHTKVIAISRFSRDKKETFCCQNCHFEFLTKFARKSDEPANKAFLNYLFYMYAKIEYNQSLVFERLANHKTTNSKDWKAQIASKTFRQNFQIYWFLVRFNFRKRQKWSRH